MSLEGLETQLELLNKNADRLIATIDRLTENFEKIISEKGYLVTTQ